MGFDFDRQKPLGNYIVDFYCKDLSLAIEIDGDSHYFNYDNDIDRQRDLEKLGIRFLRFDDIEVKKSIDNVLKVIELWIINNRPTPVPPDASVGTGLRGGDLRAFESGPYIMIR